MQECADGAIRTRAVGESRRLSGPASEIVLAARTLFERNGVRSTSVTAIMAEAGITRELFYYYFSGKQAIIEAVLDDYLEDFVETVAVWDESRSFGDTEGSLRTCVQAFRRTLYDANGLRPLVRVLDELGMRDRFMMRTVAETAAFVEQTVAPIYARYHPIDIEYRHEMLLSAFFSVIGLLKIDHEMPDAVLMKVVEQIMHLDMTPLDADAPVLTDC